MIKPSEVAIGPVTPPSDEITAVEQQFDAAIQMAAKLKLWPAAVDKRRDGVTTAAIAAVAERYRGAGWIVTLPSQGFRAIIQHPDLSKETK